MKMWEKKTRVILEGLKRQSFDNCQKHKKIIAMQELMLKYVNDLYLSTFLNIH